jgi:hypothetical protein
LRNSVLYLCIIFFSFFSIQAQIKITSEVDLTNYPSLSFDISNRNPKVKTQFNYNFFKISGSNEVLIDSISMTQVKDTLNYSKINKSVLILVESINNPQRIEQVNTFFRAIKFKLLLFIYGKTINE